MKTPALDKFLAGPHHRGCAVKKFSDGDKRSCSCGRDEARIELAALKAAPIEQRLLDHFRNYPGLDVSRQTIAGLVYVDLAIYDKLDERTINNNISVYISRVRKVLGDKLVTLRGYGYRYDG